MSRLGLMFAWTVCILLTSRGRAKSNQCICTSVFSHSLLGLANSKLGVRYMQVGVFALGGHLLGFMGSSMRGRKILAEQLVYIGRMTSATNFNSAVAL